MASDKEKRFRVHVVKELFETERDYTHQLEFTVTHILQKAREKCEHEKDKMESEKSFTPDMIRTLFCNIEEILAFHKDLMIQLNTLIESKGPAYDTKIASCYTKQAERFTLYKVYGERNEQAQKLLYELYEKQVFKAFFVACMLLGGKSDEDISGLVFKPIQRICKYPLLFRELGKYTPVGHPDYEATQEAQKIMRDVCSVINEAKRRVEKLEEIADWQATVEGWEGTNIIDTCNHLVKDGPLIKISAGNTQERQFHLFDNLLVYCKKTRKGLMFRGRVPVANLDIEDIEDGTSDYYTNGIAVNNSWKVHNVAKNKWFVLVANSSDEKHAWMEAIRKEKEKRKRQQAAMAQNNRALALDRGEKIYYQMRREKFMKDHKSRLRTYPNTFTGQELVGWLIEKKEVADNDEAVLLGQALLENGVIHHVSDRHQFKNDRDLLYRFRYDDGTFRSKINSSDITARGIRAYCRLHGQFESLIKEQKVAIGLRTMSNMRGVINSQKLIDWWLAEKDIHSRQAGVDLGQELFATGFLRHATDEQNFKDGMYLYRFTADDGHEGLKDAQRRMTTGTKVDFNILSVSTCRTMTLPYTPQGYGVELSDSLPITIQSVSPEAQLHGLCVGQIVLAINSVYTTLLSLVDLQSTLQPTTAHPPPLSLVVTRPGTSEYATLTPSTGGLGFHIKGNSPVIIHEVDKGSSASQAGIIPGCCILKVGDDEVLKASHDAVVSAVKGSIARSKQEQGKPSVRLKLSYPFLEQLSSFKYECADTSLVEVIERTVESPYTFSVPSQLLKLYSLEDSQVVSLVTKSGVTNEKVASFLDKLETLSTSYAKMSTFLSLPRWPSYKLYGSGNSPVLEPCPTNLHTTILDVMRGAESSPPSTPTIPDSTTPTDDQSSEIGTQITSYVISTMGMPSCPGHTITNEKANRDMLANVATRRELVKSLNDRLAEMERDFESIRVMILEIQGSPAPDYDSEQPNGEASLAELSLSSSLSLSPPVMSHLHNDITPSASPILGRRRHVSISNPIPVLKLVVEGLLQKTKALLESLKDRLLLSVLEDASGILAPTGKSLVAEFSERLSSLIEEVKSTVQRPGEPLSKAVNYLKETTHKYITDLCVRLWISLALVGNTGVPLLETRDKIFSQCLTSLVTSFSHSLVKALNGQLNPGVEYEHNNQEASQQWLQMVAEKGLLVHVQSTLLPTESSELSALKDLQFIQRELSHVLFHVTETNGPQHLPCTDLPPVTIKGSRDHIHVYYHLSKSVCNKLPDKFRSESGIQIVPILLNKGLVNLEEGTPGYNEEKTINMESFLQLKKYYQSLRAFRLDKSNLPNDSDAKLVAIHQISQPLNAMDILVRQVEVAVREPARPGVALLTIAAEVATRMGALRINVCESGVFRSGMATSLEQVMVLGRCHGLPFKSFRTSLNRVRRKGGFSYIVRKNNADLSKSFPSQPPKLYQLPPDSSEG